MSKANNTTFLHTSHGEVKYWQLSVSTYKFFCACRHPCHQGHRLSLARVLRVEEAVVDEMINPTILWTGRRRKYFSIFMVVTFLGGGDPSIILQLKSAESYLSSHCCPYKIASFAIFFY